ncbi:chitinase [Streptomyces sp. NPDC008150]|uniref:chitinase n=1 Tax=Streptomyces sp. NPDC008150 TaxID=3364816 RepID=UPI0036F0EBAC
MRSFLRPVGVACLLALAVTGCSSGSDGASDPGGGPTSQGSAAKGGGDTTEYAPYVSATTASPTDATGSPATYNLAFVISDGKTCVPKWDGQYGVDDPEVKARITALKKSGGSVRVSFGGASGKELASVCDSADDLAKAYGEALDAVGSTQADFDVEGAQLADAASVARRSEAIAELEQDRGDLTVSYTLPVMPSGLDDDSLALLESANDHDVDVTTVNIMTMNYGSSYGGDMGDYALTSAGAAHAQLKKVFGMTDAQTWQGMALTSMLGVQDVDNETFSLDDAAQVREFAVRKGIAWVSVWSTFRDRQCAAGKAGQDDAATDCSGVKQSSGAFAKALSGA